MRILRSSRSLIKKPDRVFKVPNPSVRARAQWRGLRGLSGGSFGGRRSGRSAQCGLLSGVCAATQGGIIYEPNDPHTLAQAFASLLTDPDRVRAMGEQGNKVVMERHTMAGMAKSIVNIYENLLD